MLAGSSECGSAIGSQVVMNAQECESGMQSWPRANPDRFVHGRAGWKSEIWLAYSVET